MLTCLQDRPPESVTLRPSASWRSVSPPSELQGKPEEQTTWELRGGSHTRTPSQAFFNINTLITSTSSPVGVMTSAARFGCAFCGCTTATLPDRSWSFLGSLRCSWSERWEDKRDEWNIDGGRDEKNKRHDQWNERSSEWKRRRSRGREKGQILVVKLPPWMPPQSEWRTWQPTTRRPFHWDLVKNNNNNNKAADSDHSLKNKAV